MNDTMLKNSNEKSFSKFLKQKKNKKTVVMIVNGT
jgi:hypothetical protein